MKILLENLVRLENGRTVTVDDIKAVGQGLAGKASEREIAFRPARVLMQDLTGVPAVVDLAAMRQAMLDLGGDPNKINPLSPVDLVIDHSVQIDNFGTPQSFAANVKVEFERNGERYRFLRWGQEAFENFRLVPPGTGICHQVNLEYLSQVVWTTDEDGKTIAYPDTLVGTDSHTTMVNGLSVLGWGVGGIEAEAAMLGQPISMLIPEVIGVRLTGHLREGATATDLVLTITQMLRRRGVVGRFVEYFGSGVAELALADRATIGNMSPEYGATCGFFPIDAETIRYLTLTARDPARVKLVEAYAKAQGLWRDANTPDPIFTDTVELDLGTVEPSLAGPRRPQDRVALSATWPRRSIPSCRASPALTSRAAPRSPAPITRSAMATSSSPRSPAAPTPRTRASCWPPGSSPRRRSSVASRSSPGSRPASRRAARWSATIMRRPACRNISTRSASISSATAAPPASAIRGRLPEPIAEAIEDNDLAVAAVLSGNRNFEGRIHAQVRANYLASPPLVVAYALAGFDPHQSDEPSRSAKAATTSRSISATSGRPIARLPTPSPTRSSASAFAQRYGNVFEGPPEWRAVPRHRRS